MDKPTILCVDDQRDVLAALRNDLEVLEPYFEIVDCESAAEALEVLDEIDAAGGHVGLIICDHVMPEKSGVDFLSEIHEGLRFPRTRRLLLTGLANHQDTIRAINAAHVHRYVEKPWENEQLIGIVKTLLTEYLIHSGLDYQPFMEVLDQQVLYRELRDRT